MLLSLYVIVKAYSPLWSASNELVTLHDLVTI